MKRYILGLMLLLSCHRENKATVALIDGSPIYAYELKKEFQRHRLDQDGGLPSAEGEQTLKRALLEDMIERRLLSVEIEKANVFVGSDEVEAAFARMRAGWQEDEFNAQLLAKDMTATELKSELRESLAVRKYWKDTVFSRIAVTDAEIDLYLQAHPETLKTQDEVRVRQIVVKTEEKALKVLAEIKGGLAFEDAAIRHSVSPDARVGGDLGYLTPGNLPKDLESACFALGVGQMSGVVPSTLGFHLFMVTDRRPAQALGNVSEKAESTIREEKEQRARLAKVKELREAHSVVIKEDKLVNIY